MTDEKAPNQDPKPETPKGSASRPVKASDLFRAPKSDSSDVAKPSSWFRKYFFIGLAGILPAALTIGLFIWTYGLADAYISQPMLGFVKMFLKTEPGKNLLEWRGVTDDIISSNEKLGPYLDEKFKYLPWSIVGIIISLFAIFTIGFIMGKFWGRKLWGIAESILTRFPGIKSVYPRMKQIVDFLFGQSSVAFDKVALIEYPRREMWSIGLITGGGLRDLNEAQNEEFVSVFMPSSPTPMTGYIVYVPVKDILVLPMTVDDAMTLIISCGVITNNTQAVQYSDQKLESRSTQRIVKERLDLGEPPPTNGAGEGSLTKKPPF
ncbi:MAG: DUF502 domain-containing protein [Planctomycetes bacterium]|nr:DUF502 domain-containing protein [Planctomycetota bacterium]